MTRMAVTADLHCDDFGSKIDPASGLNARWSDTIAMARWVARDARDRGADALIVAGDLSESRHPAPWRVAQIGDAIAEFGGPTILLRGNHDGFRAERSIVDVLAAGRPDWFGFSRPGVVTIGTTAIAALPYLDAHWLRAQPGFESVPEADVLRILAEQYLTVARGLYVQAVALASHVVLVIHQGLSGGQMSEAQQAFLGDKSLVVDARALGAIGFDAIVAGHFHMHQVISSHPLIVYAGAPTRTDFGEQNQAKGYLIVDLDDVGRLEFVETPARRFVTLTGDETVHDWDVAGCIVRCLDVPPDVDVARLRKALEADGAFEIQEIRIRRPESTVAAGGMAEGLAPAQALEEYFAADPDRAQLIERGRELLAEVA